MDIDINLNQLRVFYIAAKTQSFTRAAEVLFLTQPGISKHIKGLELYYGTRLFDRLGKKVILTQAGEVLFSAAETIFNLLENSKIEIDDMKGVNKGRLSIGASITIGIYVLPKALAMFKHLFPDIDINIDIALNQQIVDNVLNNSIDVGLLGAYVDNDRLTVERFFIDELVVVVSGHHKWISKDIIEPHDLINQQLILSKPGSGTRLIVEERFNMMGIPLKNVIEFGHTEAVKKAVESDLGISILSKLAIVHEERLGLLKSIRLSGVDFFRPFYYSYRKDKYHSNALKTFLQFIVYNRIDGAAHRMEKS